MKYFQVLGSEAVAVVRMLSLSLSVMINVDNGVINITMWLPLRSHSVVVLQLLILLSTSYYGLIF